MTTITTSYTTYDLAFYYTNVSQIPRLSDEEQQHLLSALPAHASRLDGAVRDRLIEGHLRLAKAIAIHECPPHHYPLLPDLIGEVNLALVTAAHRYNPREGGDLTAYLASYAQGAVKRAIGEQRLIRVPGSTLWKARQQGTDKRLYALQPDSLDLWMEWFETSEVEEPPSAPLLPTEAAPLPDPVLRAQVETWLAYLSTREQEVVRLRYGLCDHNERAHGVGEMAAALMLPRKHIDSILKGALRRLRALADGTATITVKGGQARVTGVFRYQPPKLTPEQEQMLWQLAMQLSEQGGRITARRLAEISGLTMARTQVFLQAHRADLPNTAPTGEALHQERLAHVAQVYAQMCARAEWVTARRLAQVAHVRRGTACEFLRTQQREQQEGGHHVAR